MVPIGGIENQHLVQLNTKILGLEVYNQFNTCTCTLKSRLPGAGRLGRLF